MKGNLGHARERESSKSSHVPSFNISLEEIGQIMLRDKRP